MAKYGRGRQVTEESILQCSKDVVFMLVNYGKNTDTHIRIFNTYCLITD